MKNCNNGRFLNEQTYLDTICRGKEKPCPPKPPCGEYVQCEYQTECGKICLRQDCRKTDLEISLHQSCRKQPRPPHSHK